jgi:hypothetical protein
VDRAGRPRNQNWLLLSNSNPQIAGERQLGRLPFLLTPCDIAIEQALSACSGQGGVMALSGQFRAGREPCVAVEEAAKGAEFADAPFGQAGLDHREVGESFDSAPASSGPALLHLDRADGALGLVVGRRALWGLCCRDVKELLTEPANRRYRAVPASWTTRAGLGRGLLLAVPSLS